MTDVVWTRDALIANAESLLALDAKGALTPHGIGHLAREIITGFLDLVRDANPLPDADGWVPHTHSLCPVAWETEVDVKYENGVAEKGVAGGFYWDQTPDGTTITHYRIVRPAPSGPVVEETVKRIVPGVYGRLHVGMQGNEVVLDLICRDGSWGTGPFNRSEILAAAETLRQIGETMEGK